MKTLDKLNPLNFLKKVNIFVNAEKNEEEEKKSHSLLGKRSREDLSDDEFAKPLPKRERLTEEVASTTVQSQDDPVEAAHRAEPCPLVPSAQEVEAFLQG